MWSLELMGLCVACMHENCWVHAACTQAFNVAKKRHLNECVLAPRLGTEARTELGLGFKGPSLGTEARTRIQGSEPRNRASGLLGSEPRIRTSRSEPRFRAQARIRVGTEARSRGSESCSAPSTDPPHGTPLRSIHFPPLTDPTRVPRYNVIYV